MAPLGLTERDDVVCALTSTHIGGAGGAGGARTHGPGVMSAHALCAVLTSVDAGHMGARGVEYSGVTRTAQPTCNCSGSMIAGVLGRSSAWRSVSSWRWPGAMDALVLTS